MAEIRPACAGDLETIASIYAHYVEQTYITFDLQAPSARAWKEKWKAACAAGYPWMVRERNGVVVGYATAAEFRPKPAYRSTAETTIYMDRAAVGQGLGRALYAAELRELSQRDFHLATAGITLPNPASVILHEALGFTAVGVFEEVGHKLDGWRDVGWWQLRL
ncbi:MAG: hypothetical protein DLM63_05035 [Solirubrobacterales bacterium]|nr:MAG: hypothetical protein DLM63_05035 [Solirubrobacterales bacterium]